ncbi:hypothetical protein D3C81_1725230 [compost metagenome]
MGFVLVEIGFGDGEQRFVRRVGIGVVLAGFVAGRGLGDAAGPRGDGAGGVAGTLGAHGGQGGFQLFGLLWGDGGQSGAGGKA